MWHVESATWLWKNVSHRSSLLGIGIASAGVVDPNTGAIVSAIDTMPGSWAGTELGAIIREATGLPVHVINDVHAHGLGEAVMGAGKGATGAVHGTGNRTAARSSVTGASILVTTS